MTAEASEGEIEGREFKGHEDSSSTTILGVPKYRPIQD